MLACLISRPSRHPVLALACLLAFPGGLGLLSSCKQKRVDHYEIQTVWYVDPVNGSDGADGLSKAGALKTFERLNLEHLGPGDEVVIAPGLHERSLAPRAIGSPEAPVTIRFLPGVHEFGAEKAERRSYFISNSVAAAGKPMPIAILVKDCRHLEITGWGTDGEARTMLLMGGRMTHFVNDHSANITYRKLVFDLKRPTVSEFRVVASGEGWSEIVMADGSTCELRDGRLHWTGDLGSGQPLMQQAIPAEGRSWRTRITHNPLERASRIEQIARDRYRLHFESGDPLVVGHQFQFRNGERDVVGAHNVRCTGLVFEDLEFNALTGMGIISQFTEDITFKRAHIIPPPDSLRTCPAWADGFHFSGCRGRILVEDCRFSGLQDDPINVHGTHLRIIGQSEGNQLLVRFMHQQTYGFEAFQPGDEIAVISSTTLREHEGNPHRKVTGLERISDRDWLLTLDGEAPRFGDNDVVDNLSWYPDLTIRGCEVDMCPTRGFLITTRSKALVEGNTLKRCRMPGVLIENDASGWFESGPVRDLLIRNNRFIGCGIRIHPRASEGQLPVHENIRIVDNHFEEGAGIEAHHVAGLVIKGNRSAGQPLPIKLDEANCEAVIEGNE